jgi:hypothetical protein
MKEMTTPGLGDLVIVLLASTLAGLRDRLADDGFQDASELAAELTERCDDYLSEVSR